LSIMLEGVGAVYGSNRKRSSQMIPLPEGKFGRFCDLDVFIFIF
jgi:hypothetical protein